MQGNPAVLDRLNAVYRLLLAMEQQAHMQEHVFEVRRWAFSDWFHDIEEKGHAKLIHPLMNRIAALGGSYDHRYGFEPAVSEEIDAALQAALEALQRVHAAYGAACEVAEADDDYVTEKLIWKSLKWVEKRINKCEARLAKLQKVGLQAFLAEYL